jgi:hypothetical protein
MITLKNFFLIFLITPGLIFIPGIKFSKSLYFITPIVILFTISLLLNFPNIIHALHGKSATIEDLKDVHSTSRKIKNRFIKIFEWSLTIMLSLLIALVIDYYLNKIDMSNLTKLEIIGVMGGIISFVYRIQSILGKTLLFILKRYKQEVMPKGLTDSPSVIELAELENKTIIYA